MCTAIIINADWRVVTATAAVTLASERCLFWPCSQRQSNEHHVRSRRNTNMSIRCRVSRQLADIAARYCSRAALGRPIGTTPTVLLNDHKLPAGQTDCGNRITTASSRTVANTCNSITLLGRLLMILDSQQLAILHRPSTLRDDRTLLMGSLAAEPIG